MAAESPEYLRTSLAAAMTLDLKKGRFYRNARSPCVNVLQTYGEGCAGSCAYCGLSLRREGTYGGKSFIRVGWPTYPAEEIIDRIIASGNRVRRVCASMVTNRRAPDDMSSIIRKFRKRLEVPVSVLLAPTVLNREYLARYKEDGADMAGVAMDCATPELFDKYRGGGAGGPHDWARYRECLAEAVTIFGPGKAGAHLIVGLGETEKEMAEIIQHVRDLGGSTHLFSFFPEAGSTLAARPPPPMGQYRRVQLARHIIDTGMGDVSGFSFHRSGRLTGYGRPDDELTAIIETGKPFMTSGCPGKDGDVACNRPYANCVPGPEIRNYPFRPENADIELIKTQLRQ